MGGRARTAAVAALAVLGAAAPASAAEITRRVVCEDYGGYCVNATYVTYTAAPGELNDVRATYRKGAVRFSDRVPIHAPKSCGRTPTKEVECAGTRVEVRLGDLDDSATATKRPTPGDRGWITAGGDGGDDTLIGHDAIVGGGAGNDRLVGEMIEGDDGDDLMLGTDGPDSIRGGTGADELHGGAGDDGLDGDGWPETAKAGSDLIDGGPGSDTVGYSARRDPVEVDTRAGSGGGTGEGDRLQSIENASGGAGADRLVGDDGPNVLDGGYDCRYDTPSDAGDLIDGRGGNDRVNGGCKRNRVYGGNGDDKVGGGQSADLLDGGPGDDLLDGGFGADRYVAGDGSDTISPNHEDLTGETVSCGAGADLVDNPGIALLQPDCEAVDEVFTHARVYPRRLGRSNLTFTIRCELKAPCRGTVKLKVLGWRRAFLVGRFKVRRGVARPRFRLPRRIAEMKRSPLPVQVIVRGKQRNRWHTPDFEADWVFDLSAAPIG
jgi:hypothetical protein